MFRASAVLVALSVALSLATWGIYAAAFFGKASDASEMPLVLLISGNPTVAITGLVITIKSIDMQDHRTWRIQFVASLTSAVLAMLAIVLFYSI